VTESLARAQLSRLSSLVALLALALIGIAGLDLASNGGAEWASLAAPHGTVGGVHLAVALMTGCATLALAIGAWLQLPGDRSVLFLVSAAVGLILVQAGALVIPTSLVGVPWRATVHFGATALLLAVALGLALRSPMGLLGSRIPPLVVTGGYYAQRFVQAAAVAVFGVLVSGAYLTSSDSPSSCTGWPLCGDLAASSAATDPQFLHRLLVGIAGVLLTVILIASLRAGAGGVVLSGILLGIFAVEALVGALSATGSESAVISGIHFGAAGLAWGLLVLLALTTAPAASIVPVGRAGWLPAARATARDYLRVTKPGIMVLLLTTTLGAMLVAPGWPSLWLVLATLAGGALASGGASALNCYLDRDIDIVMARTRRRPIPTGRLTPVQVRNFGLVLSIAAVLELWLLVNPVAALLALGGNLFYVVVYTRFLKRSTPQNIVIGGAAGAFPPLVGWAAVTGSISVTAILLFAIVYYWTPPHFWSLALLKARDYERAGIPMLPVTHGEQQTRRFILLYAMLLVPVTLLLVPAGAAGALYLVAAALLGMLFIALAWRMYREGTSRLAWRLFKYSNYYLALLLLVMVVDRALGF
jgi:protoheme IX farnesyltransferase